MNKFISEKMPDYINHLSNLKYFKDSMSIFYEMSNFDKLVILLLNYVEHPEMIGKMDHYRLFDTFILGKFIEGALDNQHVIFNKYKQLVDIIINFSKDYEPEAINKIGQHFLSQKDITKKNDNLNRVITNLILLSKIESDEVIQLFADYLASGIFYLNGNSLYKLFELAFKDFANTIGKFQQSTITKLRNSIISALEKVKHLDRGQKYLICRYILFRNSENNYLLNFDKILYIKLINYIMKLIENDQLSMKELDEIYFYYNSDSI